MIKHAQPFDPTEFANYGQGGLAGYGQPYDVGLENVGLVPGMDPRVPEQSRMPGIASPWAAPISLAAGGLIGYALLRGLGRRLATKALAQKAAPTAAATGAPVISPETAALIQQWLPKQASIIQTLGLLARR